MVVYFVSSVFTRAIMNFGEFILWTDETTFKLDRSIIITFFLRGGGGWTIENPHQITEDELNKPGIGWNLD
jgi:hypothetical protein